MTIASSVIFVLLIISIITEFLYRNFHNKWAEPSGFNFLDPSYHNFILIHILISIFLFLPTIYLASTKDIIVAFVSMNISAILFLFEIYLTLTQLINPNGVVNSLLINWEDHINTDRLNEIQRKFQCCGFHFRFQFFGDRCNASVFPCLYPLMNALSPQIRTSGRYLLIISIIQLVITVCFYLLTEKDIIVTEEQESFIKKEINTKSKESSSTTA